MQRCRGGGIHLAKDSEGVQQDRVQQDRVQQDRVQQDRVQQDPMKTVPRPQQDQFQTRTW